MPSYIRTRSEFAVNSYTAGRQLTPTVATFADGGFIVTWMTNDPAQDGAGNAIKAQLFDSAGRKVGYEFLVNADAGGDQFQPKVTTLPDGKFVVAWLTQVGGGVPNSIKAQLFDRSGVPIGSEVQVNATGTSISEPNVTALADGRYLVSWDDSSAGMRAQIFDSAGARTGGIVTLATYGSAYGEVIGLANGGFVATWRESWDIMAQIFSPSGAKVGLPFLAHTNTSGYQNEPSAVALAGGGFVLAWTDSNGGPGSVRAQAFSATGQRVGGELVVNSQSGDFVSSPVVTALPDGGFFVAWHVGAYLSGGGSNTDVKGQRFSAAGVKVDGEMLINSNTAGSQSMPDLATLADGRIIATWSSDVGDRDSWAIRAQILGTEPAAPLPNTAPTIITKASLTHDEGLTAVTTIVASDDGEPNNLFYSITGGLDSAFFTINSVTGALAFKAKPDHETPLDKNGDNHYEVTVSATDGSLSGSKALSVYVRDANQVTIVSDGGDYSTYFLMGENESAVTVVSAVDAEGLPLSYSISGGDDAALFTIDAQTGELSFITAPDFELPRDRYGYNYYVVEVKASDGTFSDTQRIDIQVGDVVEDGQVVITSDGGEDEAELSVEENSVIATTVSATGSGVVYEIVGGYDAWRFSIDSVTGILSFAEVPDYEDMRGDLPWTGYNPRDWDYQLEVIVRASDGASLDEQYLIFNITDADEAPEFYSYGGDAHVNVPVPEGEVEAAEVIAYDPDRSHYPNTAPTYEIQGADAAFFQLDLLQHYPERGILRFIVSPDYESPADADGDNVYEVTVVAHSGGLSASQSYSVWVLDSDDPISIGSDGGGDQASLWMPENSTAVAVVAASGGSGAFTYSIAGGADASAFVIDSATGELAFAVSPDHEVLADADGDNVYDVVVRASDSSSFDDQSLSVHVYDVDEALYFPDYPNGEPASLTMTENATHVAHIFAVDPDFSSAPIAYSIEGGADAALFAIDPDTGELSLIRVADFENPADADGDNVYEVEVAATSGSWTRIQAFSVTVEDEYENVAITFGGTASAAENGVAVTTVTAFADGDPVSFSISGGADSALFAIDPETGALSFVEAPDFEAPADSDGDNVYEVEVSAGDGRSADSKLYSVTVTNQNEFAPTGGEFVVNSTYQRTQADSDVTRLADGNFVIVWIDADYNTTTGRFLRAQIFAPDGVKIGGELTLHSDYTVGIEPEVAALPDGGFVVVWKSFGDVVARMYDSAGEATTGRLDVGHSASNFPEVAVLSNGGFAITWSGKTWNGSDFGSSEIRLRLYDPAGVPVGGERIVNASVAGEQFDSSIAALAGGGYVVSWTDSAVRGGPSIGKAQIFDSAGARVGGELIVAEPEGHSGFIESNVVALSNGNFAVAWSQGLPEGGPGHGIQIFTPEGVKVGGQIVVPSHAYGRQEGPSITALSDGGFAVAWSPDSPPYYDGSGRTIYVQAYDASGQPSGVPTRVNGQVNGDQIEPSIAGLGDGRFVVTWADLNGTGADDDQVMARIFAPEGYVPNQRPVFDSPASVQVDEGQTAVALVAASDSDGPGAVTYSIAGGADSALFEIDPATGALHFKAAPDREAPGSDNLHEVVVRAYDGELSSFQALQVAVRNVNEGVTVTSGATASVAENATSVTVVTASDVDGDPVSFAISGGADASLFAIDAATGALSFLAAPDFEAPADSDGDNVYHVEVSASDGLLSDSRSIEVTVGNSHEGPSFAAPTRAFSVNEETAPIGAVSARAEAGAAIVYAIAGGADASLFAIDPATGTLSWVSEPDHEDPTDLDGDNVYDLVVSASDGTSTASQAVSVSVEDVFEPVEIVSYGGAESVSLTVTEGYWMIGAVVHAVDEEGYGTFDNVVYSITGGADAALFSVNPNTGALDFTYAGWPDFESPADADGDNVYEVVVTAATSVSSDAQAFAITIANLNERLFITSDGGDISTELWLNEGERDVTIVVAEDPDGTAPAYSIVGGPDADLFTIDAATGALSLIEAPDFEAPTDSWRDNVYTVIVSAGDGEYSSEQTLYVSIADVNEGVTITSGGGAEAVQLEIGEDGLRVADIEASDVDGDAVAYSISGGADASRFAIDAETGVLSFAQAVSFEAPGDADGDNIYDVVVSATDGSFADSQSFSVAVTDVDDPVQILSYGGAATVALSVLEDDFAVGTVQARDDEESVTYAITGGIDGESFEIDPLTGALSFRQPNAGDFEDPTDFDSDNVHEVVVTASSSTSSATQAFMISIANRNEAPGFHHHSSLTVNEGVQSITTLFGYDRDGDSTTLALVGGADAAFFVLDPVTNLLSFTQARDFEAPLSAAGTNVYVVEIEASDGQLTTRRSLEVTIRNVNEAVAITSGGGGDTAAVTVAENGTAVTTIAASDVDGDALTYSITGGADWWRFAIDAGTGVLRFVQAQNFEDPWDAGADHVYDVVVSVTDGALTDSQALAVTVANLTETVTITSGGGGDSASVAVGENGTAVTTVAASAPGGDRMTYAIAGGADAARFTINATTGALAFAAAPNFEAPADAGADNVYDVVVSATNGDTIDTQALSVTVGNVDDQMTITSNGGGATAAVSVNENSSLVTNVVGTDPDGAPVTYVILHGGDSSLFTINSTTGMLSFRAAPNFEAPADSDGDNVYTVRVMASDGGWSDDQTITVTVANLVEPVAITSNGGAASGSVAVAENGTAVASVTAASPDGGTLTYAIAGGADAARFTIDASTGALAFVSAPNFEAPADAGANNVYDVVVSASNGSSSDTQALAVTVGNVDEPVTITSSGGGSNASVTRAENGIAVGVVAAVDTDGRAVTYSIAGGADASRFTIDAATGALAFIAAPNFEAPTDSGGDNVYDVVVSASDGSFADTQALAVTVSNVNEAPAITSAGGGASGSVSVAENGLAVAVVAATDPDGGPATYSIVGGADAARFTINVQTGALQFVAAPDWELPADSNQDNVYSVVVRASDGQLFDDQALSVTVSNVRDGNNVTGTAGGDSISATSLNPALRTSNEEDLVFGRDGHDTIHGMAGADELYGEAGNDVLVGGEGSDKLLGGLGKDTFTYNAVADSTVALRDLIMDFSRSQGDKISLSAIDANSQVSSNQAFTFIGMAAFSNVAGQLRYETVAGVTTISGDVNGDGIADLQIQLSGSIALISSDFIL